MRILLVEPDDVTAEWLKVVLNEERMLVERASDIDFAIDLAKVYPFDLIVAELEIAGESGLDLIRTLRSRGDHTPILVISSLPAVEDKVRAFGFGADEYMVKPVHRDELVARILAVVRRDRGMADPHISVGNMTLTMGAFVEVAGDRVHLTRMQMILLEALTLNIGRTCSRESLMQHLYGGADDEPDEKVLDAFMCHLRRKLRLAGWAGGQIKTVWGLGWTIETVSVHAEAAA